MNFIKNLPIKNRLFIVSVIPLLSVLLVSSLLILNSYNNYKNYSKLELLIKLNSDISTFVHETQKERGATAGFIGSKGAKFSKILEKQRVLTDEKLKNLETFIKTGHINELLLESSVEDLKNLLSNVHKIEKIRDDVDNFRISGKNAIAYYTNINADLLKFITLTFKQSNDADISLESMAYYSFLEAKERAGIERAVGASIFSSDKLPQDLKAKFITLIAKQDSYLHSFDNLATKEFKEFEKSTVQGKDIDDVIMMREKIITNNGEGNFGVNSVVWFETITRKINLLKKVDDFISNYISNDAKKKKDESFSNFIAYIIFVVLVLLVTSLLGTYITKTIIDAVLKIREGIETFFDFMNRKRNTFEYIDVTSRGELGEIAKFINRNLETLDKELEADMKCVGEAILVLNKLQQGNFNNQVMAIPANPQIRTFANTINKMLKNQELVMNNILKELESYTNYNYLSKLSDQDMKGEMKKLIEGINSLGEAITLMLRENKQNGDILNQNSNILSANVEHLNSSALSQAASIEETAASVEETTSSINEISSQSMQMQTLSKETLEYATEGLSLATKTQKSMNEINSATQEINEAITIIDQIAFQTNILSLNAAVEAATAGEAGKGFAVVAQEVRNLASRSAEAAREIKTLVEKANMKAEEGKGSSEKMIQGYTKLNEKIQNTSSIITKVSDSTQEQSKTISQINEAISRIDELTQENAKVASQTKDIAIKTSNIANEIIENTNNKQFLES